jgi:hypothetical protein
MPRAKRGSVGQLPLLPTSIQAMVQVSEEHEMVRLARALDWVELERAAAAIREQRVKGPGGRIPHLRVMLGAMALMALRRKTYRETEDLLRHYVPARYLCDLMDSPWTPDFTTLQDFAELMGEEGMEALNEAVVKMAVAKGFEDPRVAVADMTAQEAAIPYPNEVGLMGSFARGVGKAIATLGRAGSELRVKMAKGLAQVKKLVRKHRLFAKTGEARREVTTTLLSESEKLLAKVSEGLPTSEGRLTGVKLKALRRLRQLRETMTELVPQIHYWLKKGKVASGKIINLKLSEIRSIVRGKSGKPVEFGLKWGIARLKNGFVLGTSSRNLESESDQYFATAAVCHLKMLFGKAPVSYAYDRGGWSRQNVADLRTLGVRNVGLAPKGRARWAVSGKTKERLVRVRAQVEGSIGTVKSPCYGFNKPNVRTTEMMAAIGQRALLGFNLRKYARAAAA